jgi:hypothetical protein
VPTQFDHPASAASATASGCDDNSPAALRRSVKGLAARIMGAPLWACAALAALGLIAALLLALR